MLERDAMEEETVFEASPDVAEFYRLLIQRFPALEDVPEKRRRDPRFSPWSQTPQPSDRCVGLTCRLDTPRKVFDEILSLGKRFHLILYDPQDGVLRRL
jgi:hypothetical protein